MRLVRSACDLQAHSLLSALVRPRVPLHAISSRLLVWWLSACNGPVGVLLRLSPVLSLARGPPVCVACVHGCVRPGSDLEARRTIIFFNYHPDRGFARTLAPDATYAEEAAPSGCSRVN